MNNGINLVDAFTSLRAMSYAPYTTMSAMAELVDNSIQAKASYVALIAQDIKGRTAKGSEVKYLDKLAVYDNGMGMNAETIANALAVGFSRNKEDKKGMGKFGYGLTVGSVSQANRIDVYSWQKKGEYLHTYIDMDELKDTRSQVIPEVKAKKKLPIIGGHKWDKNLTPGESGTLIIWSDLTKSVPRTSRGVISSFSNDLSRIYRHFLDDDDDYGKKRNIEIIHLNQDTTIYDRKELLPNDPLYLLTPNTLPELKGIDYSKMETNELQQDIPLTVDYFDESGQKKTSQVRIIMSMAKPAIRDLGGNSSVGKHYARNIGISFVRAGREIKIDHFGWTNPAEVRHRWLGIEVRFSPELDDYFGLSADKQNILNMKAYNDSNPPPITYEEDDLDLRLKFFSEFDAVMKDNISILTRAIKKQKEGSKSGTPMSVEEKSNEILKSEKDKTSTSIERSKLTKAESTQEHKSVLEKTEPQLSEEEIKELAEQKSEYVVDLIKDDWPGTQFIETVPVGKSFQGRVNTRTKFFDIFYGHLESLAEKDPKPLDALKIILMAYSYTEDRLRADIDPERKIFPKINQVWGEVVDRLIDQADE